MKPGSQGPDRPDPTISRYMVQTKGPDNAMTEREVFLRTPAQAKNEYQLALQSQAQAAKGEQQDKDQAFREGEAKKNRENQLKVAQERTKYQTARDENSLKLREQIVKMKGSPKLTESEANSAQFGERAIAAHDIMRSLEDSGYNRASQMEDWKDALLPGVLTPDELKKQQQSELDFLTAVLRKESGASILESEFEIGEKVYFPRPGDTTELLANKAQSRENAIRGLLRGAGTGAKTVKGSDKYGEGIVPPNQQQTPAAQPNIAPVNSDDQAAIQWIQANPDDPKAEAIKASLKAKGVKFPEATPSNVMRIPTRKMG